MEHKEFNVSIKNIANRYNEEISKMVLRGIPITPQALDAIWEKHCTHHADAMYVMIRNNFQHTMNKIAQQIHTDITNDISRNVLTEVECMTRVVDDDTIKIIVGLKIGSRYIPHSLGYTINVSGSAIIRNRDGDIISSVEKI